MDFAAAGLLDGLHGDERAARERLLQELANDGFSLEELRSAVAEDRLALLPVERVLGGRYTAKEIEQRSGVDSQLLVRMWRLLGLPEPAQDDREFSDEDVEAAQSLKLFLETGISDEAIGEMTRVLGEALSRLAATTTDAFAEAFLEPGDSEPEVAVRFANLAQKLAPAMHPVIVAAYDAHLRERVRRGVIGRTELVSGTVVGEEETTVCFADLVGFTRLGGQVEAEELGTVAGRLAGFANEVSEPPVRLVKTIGDAAMLVSPEPGPLVAAALSLVEAANQADLPALRAGIASGPALLRAGDFYGHSVNRASRVTGIARPGSVLCTEEVHDAAPDKFEWSFAGRHRLKGIADAMPLFRARRLGEQPPQQSGRRQRRRGGRARKH